MYSEIEIDGRNREDFKNKICTKKSDKLKACSSPLVNPITVKLDEEREKMKYRMSQKWDVTDCVHPELLQRV